MNKKQEILLLQETIEKLTKTIDSERKANQLLTEMCYKHEAQLARKKINENENEAFKTAFSNIIYNDNRETAISIFSWENLAESPLDFFNSKRLESQIFNFAPICVFEHEIIVPGEKNPVPVPLALPFVPDSPALDCYSEFPVIRPYSPNGSQGDPTGWARTDLNPFSAKIVGKDCIIISDYFELGETNGNTSMSLRQAVRVYSDLIAECENAKRLNRNWIKIPLLFNTDGAENTSEMNKLITEVNAIVSGVEEGANALLTKYARNIEILNTGIQYFGNELENSIKDYQNKLWNFLGIGHIFNENKAQKVTAEFEKTRDEYNINITKRLQLREKALKQLKTIIPRYFSNASIKVNLDGFKSGIDASNDKQGKEEGDE